MTTLNVMTKVRNIAPFGLRVPPELKTKLECEAVKNKSSLNAEIVARLIASEKPAKLLCDYTDAELIAELMLRYERGEIYIRIGNLKEDAN